MMRRRSILKTGAATLTIVGLSLIRFPSTMPEAVAAESDAAKRHEIDAKVNATLSRLFETVKGSNELVAKADGVLVFPAVIKAGFVAGGEYGQGALRVGGKTVGYYSTAAGSFGLQAGAQSKAVIFLFMTRDSLNSFRNSKGWSVGGEGSVALVKVGANGQIDTTTATAPVQAIVMTNAGLMGDVSLSGTKISRLKI
ncbi:BPSL1445 family SYLF domain-containing lipoprotein [Paraburkholderia nodosa]|uniref:BPSL1445 family SYLF domain-containing lipoprotein n=1 Tax=Paraburkholderia nodosa TaxID=392320 RepID=UPI000484D198|nr:YSC84-related protein [Paraburkholderia nodosa]